MNPRNIGYGSFAVVHPLPEWAKRANAEAEMRPLRELWPRLPEPAKAAILKYAREVAALCERQTGGRGADR